MRRAIAAGEEVTFGAEQFLHQGVGRDAQHAAAGLEQGVPDGAQPVAFAHAGQTEGEHIGRRLEYRQRTPAGKRLQLLHQRARQPTRVERLERLAGRQTRSPVAAGPSGAGGAPRLRPRRLPGNTRQRVVVAGLRQSRHQLFGRRRQVDTASADVVTCACSAPSSVETGPVNKASYCARSGQGICTTGTVGTGGRTSAWSLAYAHVSPASSRARSVSST